MVIGRALGRTEQAQRAVPEVQTKIKQVRDAIQTINSTSDYAAQLLSDLELASLP